MLIREKSLLLEDSSRRPVCANRLCLSRALLRKLIRRECQPAPSPITSRTSPNTLTTTAEDVEKISDRLRHRIDKE